MMADDCIFYFRKKVLPSEPLLILMRVNVNVFEMRVAIMNFGVLIEYLSDLVHKN
jgi:hypothetical protein